MVAVINDVIGAGLEGELHELVLGDLRRANQNLALPLETMRHGTGLGHVATVIVKGLAHFGRGAVLIIGRNLDNDADTTGGIAFVGEFFVNDAGDFTGTLLHRPLDIVRRHIRRAGLIHQRAEASVGLGTTAARTSGEGDFFRQHGENLAALCVDDGLMPLGRVPFAMT